MNYWKGFLIAVVFDLAWVMGSPSLVTGPEPPLLDAGAFVMPTTPEDAQLNEAGRLEDSMMVHLQSHGDDVAAMVNLARMYVAHGWYDAAIGPLARAVRLDPERRSAWSLLDRSLKMTGKAQITDTELTQRAQKFEEAVEMWGHGC
jgi:cytochrome c-type biogenesis protein CcmH/NrfG